MRVSTRRVAVTVLSALAAASVFTTPADARSQGDEISVQEFGHISEDGRVTLFGTYSCTPSSPRGVHIQVTLAQDGTQLGFGGEEAVCDGAEHAWSTSTSLRMTPDVHPGPATAQARLQSSSLHSGMTLRVSYLAQAERNIVLEEKHR
ncbi:MULTISPECIES: DUF6299 family protein [unclassified Streptomyces]|nr:MULTISPECIES: DUF6299 family protein [unclassified Streptomyces]WSR26448.1 DUF6299 family protein [Streptomyces sp. NBC_01205]